jgi:hypothetical protein
MAAKRKMSYAQSEAFERMAAKGRAAQRERAAARAETEATETPAQREARLAAKATYRQARAASTACMGTYRALNGGWERCQLGKGHSGNHGPATAAQ